MVATPTKTNKVVGLVQQGNFRFEHERASIVPMVHNPQLAAYMSTLIEAEDEPLRAARARSEENDIDAVSAETGAFLRFLARAVKARSVVEVGSGGGYSGLWFLGGMDNKGILTTIESDSDHQNLSQQAYGEAGQASRVRSLLGPALSMLPKLADDSYDIVFLDADPVEYPEYLEHGIRLLKPGGLLVAHGALADGKIADPSEAGLQVDAMRQFNDLVAENPDFQVFLLPVGRGLLGAVWRANA